MCYSTESNQKKQNKKLYIYIVSSWASLGTSASSDFCNIAEILGNKSGWGGWQKSIQPVPRQETPIEIKGCALHWLSCVLVIPNA